MANSIFKVISICHFFVQPLSEQPSDFIEKILSERTRGSLDRKESIRNIETQLIYMELIYTASICARTRVKRNVLRRQIVLWPICFIHSSKKEKTFPVTWHSRATDVSMFQREIERRNSRFRGNAFKCSCIPPTFSNGHHIRCSSEMHLARNELSCH